MTDRNEKDQLRRYVEQWRRAAPELERIRNDALRAYQYNPDDADTLLTLGDNYDGPPRLTSGLVEMQRLFMEYAKRQ